MELGSAFLRSPDLMSPSPTLPIARPSGPGWRGVEALRALEPGVPRALAGDGVDHQPGEIIASKYRLERVLGVGGMGAVWLARNLTLDVDVAIKLVRRELAAPAASARLLREARAAAQLAHPSVVRVFDFGACDGGDPFIVMELLRGRSIADVLRVRGRLPALHAVQMLLPVASALAAAHARGIVHRDLKPDNVLLVEGEAGTVVPKVVDFGIAQLGCPGDGHLTGTGTVLGTPDYMSPEQARGRSDLDARTDVWSLAVLLYESIAGQLPFEGENNHAVLGAILMDEPLPSTDYAAGDDELWDIVRVALSKDRAARWPSMRAFGRALAAWAVERGASTDVTGASIPLQWLAASDGCGLLPATGEDAVEGSEVRFVPRSSGGGGAGRGALAHSAVGPVVVLTGSSAPPLAKARGSWGVAAVVGAVLALLGVAAFGAHGDAAPAAASPAAAALEVQPRRLPPSTEDVPLVAPAEAPSVVIPTDPVATPTPSATPKVAALAPSVAPATRAVQAAPASAAVQRPRALPAPPPERSSSMPLPDEPDF